MSQESKFETILVEKRERVGLVTLNRPKALNALCAQLIAELEQALNDLEADANIGVIVVTGSDQRLRRRRRHQEMKDRTFIDVFTSDFITKGWERLAQCRKPTIAAVARLRAGGGCELAMMCDMIIAAETAKFGQPEITIGIIPGAGGTQRLTRAVGKAKAMDLVPHRPHDGCGRSGAQRPGRAGRAGRQTPGGGAGGRRQDRVLPLPTALIAKEAVNQASKPALAEGLKFERRVSTPPSPPRTRRKAWPPSPRSGRPSSSTADPLEKVLKRLTVQSVNQVTSW